MRQNCVLLAWIAIAASSGCAGVSPRPQARAIDQLAVVQLDADQEARRNGAVEAAITAVVQRRYDTARRAAEQALAIDPRAARARAVLGMVLLQSSRLVDPPDLQAMNLGEVEVLTAEALAPADAFVGWMHAVFLAETGHMSAAAAAAEAALGRTKDAPPAERAALLGVAGTYRYELGEDRAALPHLQAYVVLRPDDATANFRLGSSSLRISQVVVGVNGLRQAHQHAEAAARAFERSYRLAPGDEDAGLSVGQAWMRAAQLAQRRGDDEKGAEQRALAAAAFAAVAVRFPTSPEPWFCAAAAHELDGDLPAAVGAYEQALARDGAHLPSLLNLAALRDGDAAFDRKDVLALLRRVVEADAARQELTSAERDRVDRRIAELEGRGGGA